MVHEEAYRRPDALRAGPGPSAKRHEPVIRYVARNRRARHDYDILETYECGIALKGAEVKSLRLGQASLQDAYARIEDGELWLVGAHLAPYEYASGFGRFDPVRARKLLLHRREIDELAGRVAQKALTLVPLSIYFKDGLAKVEIALARGRRLYDKRHAIAERDADQGGRARDPRARAPAMRHDSQAVSSSRYEPTITKGVTGFDFGCQVGRSEPWSPEPR